MTTFLNITTDTWSISMPEDLQERTSANDGQLYWESSDGTKGLYLEVWDLKVDDIHRTEEVLESFKASTQRSLAGMSGNQWALLAEK